jgi:hypothetical protein
MTLFGKEKIYYLIDRIQDERELTSDNEDVGIKKDYIVGKYDQRDLQVAFTKLETENVAKLVGTPVDQNWMRYMVKILPDFDKYVEKLEEDPNYLEWSGKEPKHKGGLLNAESRVDFSRTAEQNKDKYISVGQIIELDELPEAEREKVIKESLTKEHIKDLADFKKTANDLIREPVLENFSISLPPNYGAEQVSLLRQLVKQQKSIDVKDSKRTLTITYTKSRQVLLNDIFQLAQPTFNGENDLVFGFLVQNANKPFSKRYLEDQLKIKITKPFHKIIENLGFRGDLARVFFSVSKNDICFKNPVTQNEVEEMGIGKIRINKTSHS